MPTYRAPRNDEARVTFFKQTIQAATQDIEAGKYYISQETLDEVIAFLPGFETKANDVLDKKGNKTKELREQNDILEQLEMTLRHFWRSLIQRVTRLKEPVEVLTFYGLPHDGTIPNPTTRKGWITFAQTVVEGEEKTVAKGYEAMANPSAQDLQTLLDIIDSEMKDVAQADRIYDEAQEIAAVDRPRADELVLDIMSALRYNLRKKDNASIRRIMRTYGADYRYMKDEPVDEEEEIPDEVVNEDENDPKGKKDEHAAAFEPTSEAAFNQ